MASLDNKTVQITLCKSPIGYKKDQKATIKALGLRKMNQTVEHPDNPCIRGMISKISHLVRISEE